MTRPVAVIIPTLDEEAHIGSLLDQLGRLSPALVGDILIADGGSRDRTRPIVAEASRRDPRVRLVDNPRRIQSAGINTAAALLDPAVSAFVRIDAHATYPDDYVPRIAAELERTGAHVLATRLLTVGVTPVQRAIAAASNSVFGAGGSAHRQGGYSGPVDHGHHAGFDRAMFDRIGGYDPGFVANEDAEYDVRVRRAGGAIWLAGDIEAVYHPRRTIRALARQYWRYGMGRAGTFLKHRERLRVRQLLPALLSAALLCSALALPFSSLAITMPLLYLAGIGVATAILVARGGGGDLVLAFPALAAMHLGWGYGFLWALARSAAAPGRKDQTARATEAEQRGGADA